MASYILPDQKLKDYMNKKSEKVKQKAFSIFSKGSQLPEIVPEPRVECNIL